MMTTRQFHEAWLTEAVYLPDVRGAEHVTQGSLDTIVLNTDPPVPLKRLHNPFLRLRKPWENVDSNARLNDARNTDPFEVSGDFGLRVVVKAVESFPSPVSKEAADAGLLGERLGVEDKVQAPCAA